MATDITPDSSVRESQEDVVETLRRNEWRQGSVLPPELITEAKRVAPESAALNADSLLLVASHDCDVMSRDLVKEPYVELIVAHPVKKIDGNLKDAKNSRILHINLTDGSYVEIKAYERFFADRSILAMGSPEHIQLASKDQRVFRFWLGNRFNRSGFPDAFNDLINHRDHRKHKEALEKSFKSREIADLTYAIFLRLTPEGELTEGESYSVLIIAAMPPDLHKEHSTSVKKQLSLFAAALGQMGIEVEDYDAVPSTAITLEDALISLRFDFDSLSLRTDDSLPPLKC